MAVAFLRDKFTVRPRCLGPTPAPSPACALSATGGSPASLALHSKASGRGAGGLVGRDGRRLFPQRRRVRCCASVATSSQPQPQQQQQALGGSREWESMEEVYDALAGRLLALAVSTPRGKKCMVALAGPPGAGKSTVAAAVVQRVNDPQWRQAALASGSVNPPSSEAVPPSSGPGGSGEINGAAAAALGDGEVAVSVPMDGFHLYRWQLDCMPNPREAHARRGAPWTFDPAALYRFLRRILDQGSGFLPSFDHGVGDPVERDIFVGPGARVVLVEGNYLLFRDGDWGLLQTLFSETWFIDVDVDEAMRRVEDRHVGTGNTRELASFRVRNNDRPNALSVLATKEAADLVIPSVPMKTTF